MAQKTPTRTRRVTCPRCGARTLDVVTPVALKRMRRAAGVTQQELASRVGVSNTYISHIEHGRCLVSQRMLQAYRAL